MGMCDKGGATRDKRVIAIGVSVGDRDITMWGGVDLAINSQCNVAMPEALLSAGGLMDRVGLVIESRDSSRWG